MTRRAGGLARERGGGGGVGGALRLAVERRLPFVSGLREGRRRAGGAAVAAAASSQPSPRATGDGRKKIINSPPGRLSYHTLAPRTTAAAATTTGGRAADPTRRGGDDRPPRRPGAVRGGWEGEERRPPPRRRRRRGEARRCWEPRRKGLPLPLPLPPFFFPSRPFQTGRCLPPPQSRHGATGAGHSLPERRRLVIFKCEVTGWRGALPKARKGDFFKKYKLWGGCFLPPSTPPPLLWEPRPLKPAVCICLFFSF